MNLTTLNALAIFPVQLEEYYAAIPPEFTNWAPPSWEGIPSKPFTAIEQICHVRDIEIGGYHMRFDRTLHEHNPVLASLDGEALARDRSYATSNATEVLASFRTARASTLDLT